MSLIVAGSEEGAFDAEGDMAAMSAVAQALLGAKGTLQGQISPSGCMPNKEMGVCRSMLDRLDSSFPCLSVAHSIVLLFDL